MRHIVIRLAVGIIWLIAAVVCCVQNNYPFAGLYPIADLYRSGIDVTINSDDVLIFDSDVSKEYLRLYQCGCLDAAELNDIRKNGLKTI